VTLPVIVTTSAQGDLELAALEYEAIEPGLGDRFIAAFEVHSSTIGDYPLRNPVYYRNLRKFRLRPFPFLTLYRVLEHRIQVVAIVDARKDPKAIHRKLRTR
jgi:toxin ParE1/3/4